MKLRRLPDSELSVLMALWQAPAAVPRAYLEEKLKDKGWSSNTINTYLARLAEKGFIACERRGKANYYTPVVAQETYLAYESKTFLNKLFGSSLKNFVATLSQSKELTDEDLAELEEFVETLKRREKDA